MHSSARSALAFFCSLVAISIGAPPAQAESIRDQQWYLQYLKIAEVHRITQGQGVTVAVVDSGVEPHPDLRGNLLPGIDTTSNSSGIGQEDLDGHGTEMAGIIAASNSNGGALGVAPRAKILPVRVKTVNTDGSDETVAAGINWATAHGAKVINISLSGGTSTATHDAIDAAIAADVVVIAGAGNTTMGMYGVGFPAAYEGVVAVGATGKDGSHADVSVTGKEISITAPGVNIVSTTKGGKYQSSTGTSNSSAIISGAVALIRSRYPTLSAKEVIHRVLSTATDKGSPGRDPEYGYGELNLVAALTAEVPPLTPEPTLNSTSESPTSSANPSPTSFSYQKKRNDNSAATIAVISIASLLATGLLVTLVTLRIRDNREKSNGS